MALSGLSELSFKGTLGNEYQAVPLKPILDRVLVREIPIETSKIIGTHIEASQHYQRESDRGVVVAVGDGVAMGGVFLPMPVQIGDTVIMGEYGRDKVYMRPEDEFSTDKSLPTYYLMRVADLKGIVRA